MPAPKEPQRKRSRWMAERASQKNATAMLAAMAHPVYFVPATPPAKAPASTAQAARGDSFARENTSTPMVAKKTNPKPGAPAPEISQNTTGVTRNTSAPVHFHGPLAHRRIKHAQAAA